MRKNVVLFSVFLAVLGASSAVRGDPLTLSSSSHLVLDFEGDFFRFVGPSFDLNGRMGFGESIRRVHEPGCGPCFPGDVVNFGFRTIGFVDLGTGEGIVNGVEFPSLQFTGFLRFDAAFPFPEPPDDDLVAFTVSGPFRFAGAVRAFAGQNLVFEHDLRGAGIVRQQFVASDNGLPPWDFAEDSTGYDFGEATPVPEPSTLVLVGLGAVALSRARRAHRH
jgi:hypothetical protein